MRLLLVRHGETVDNVASVYAGSRDSALTAHGVLQAHRLATHLAATHDVTHVFSSDLQRAAHTAAAIVEAQERKEADQVVEVVQLADLRERDLGSAEGKRIGGAGDSGTLDDAETREAMRVRAERFLAAHLQPLLVAGGDASIKTVVVVSHGLYLNVLLSTLLRQAAPAELARLAATSNSTSGSRRGDVAVGWRNTGYVEMVRLDGGASAPRSAFSLAVTTVNSIEHLQGLKKTRGGIGSAAFDAKQRTMDSFFGPAAKQAKK